MIFVNGQELLIDTFPNGESLIKINQFNEVKQHYQIELRFEDNSDLMKLYMLKKHLDNEGKLCRLVMSYMPYSRMDRTKNEFVFTLKYICQFINDLNFYKVTITEPHSDVTEALLDRCNVNWIAKELVHKVLSEIPMFNVLIFFPDYGAYKRYSSLFKDIGFPIAWGNKHRDFSTGKITHMEVMDTNKSFESVIIVDDLCSYGGTFIIAGKALRELGARKIFLCVAHCEKSITKGDIFTTDIIDHVITTNSILQTSDLTEKQKQKVTFYKGDY